MNCHSFTKTRTFTCKHPGCTTQVTTTARNGKYCPPHAAELKKQTGRDYKRRG